MNLEAEFEKYWQNRPDRGWHSQFEDKYDAARAAFMAGFCLGLVVPSPVVPPNPPGEKMDYLESAISDAWSMAQEFADTMVEQHNDNGRISDDINNDYAGGDSYHHENHVDKAYSLKEAAELLDQLDRYEEDDNGLWQGQDPREAISTQAAFTYGNAVYCQWINLVDELNGELNGVEYEENENEEAFVRAYIKVRIYLENYKGTTGAEMLFNGAINDLDAYDWSSTLALSDWLEENDVHAWLGKEFRNLITDAKEKVEVEKEDDEEEVEV